ncbi:MAG: DNA translocase FtsK 4TM domain-containing protein [Desulfobacterota bacterium]|nr:DNA translocase FtsK 4TM domain-containing protein [Thermodesulfobacteriota bacterium]MDW8001127.1 DNA translocase FtsK 4TM domain-containing protein [Deltaproteobacteria bacterium]
MSSDLKKELAGVSLFGIFLFLLFSLISYHPFDPSFTTVSSVVHNYCGKAGSYISDLLIQCFGLSSYILLFYILVFSFLLLRKKKLASYSTFFAGLVLLFVSISAFLQIFVRSIKLKGMEYPISGLFGVLLESSLLHFFGYLGTSIILSFVFISSIFLIVHAPLIKHLEDRIKRKKQKERKREIKVAGMDDTKVEPQEMKKEFVQESFEFFKSLGPYKLPPIDLLDPVEKKDIKIDKETINLNAKILEKKLKDYGIEGAVREVTPGPVITLYEFEPAPGIKISRIANLSDDLAMALSATSIRIVAPIPGKSVVGIEIPNPVRQTVYLREIIESRAFVESHSYLTLALGKTIYGEPFVADLAKMPHLLVAGSTGSGKSVSLNSMICSILFKATPIHVRFLMIDLKMLELSFYDGIPHLLLPVVTNPKNAKLSLRWLIDEMERRYTIMAQKGVRNIDKYNQKMEKEGNELLPYIVVVIDELADLMMVSTREVEEYIARLAQMARASGIHLIIATQRPSVDVLTGIIKANFPARISFQVSSKVDSRTILDTNGAESLLGQGDMLFLSPGIGRLQRIHGPFVSENEIRRIVDFLKSQGQPSYQTEILEEKETKEDEDEFYDEKYEEAKEFVIERGEASISMIQRRFRIGYNRAARIIERMEKEGIIGPSDGVRPREVLKRK